MDSYAPLIMQTAGYLTAALAVWILIRCAISMLQEKYEPEVWAYLEMPDGSSRPINNWECILGRSHAALQKMNHTSLKINMFPKLTNPRIVIV